VKNRKRASNGYHGGVWDQTKCLLDESVMGMNNKSLRLRVAKLTHVCIRCWLKLALGYDVKTGRWLTTRVVAHATKYHKEDSKIGQQAAAREDERATKLRRQRTAAGEFQHVKLCVSVMYTVVLFFLVLTSV